MSATERFVADLVERRFESWEEVRREASLLGLYARRDWHPEEGDVLVLVGEEDRVLAVLDLNGGPIYLAPLENWPTPLLEV